MRERSEAATSIFQTRSEPYSEKEIAIPIHIHRYSVPITQRGSAPAGALLSLPMDSYGTINRHGIRVGRRNIFCSHNRRIFMTTVQEVASS